jgi:hypothetical protein
MPTGYYPMETMPRELTHLFREVACDKRDNLGQEHYFIELLALAI